MSDRVFWCLLAALLLVGHYLPWPSSEQQRHTEVMGLLREIRDQEQQNAITLDEISRGTCKNEKIC